GPCRGRRDAAPQVPLPGPAATGDAACVAASSPSDPHHPQVPRRAGIRRRGDTVAHAVDAGGRTRLPRAVATAAGLVLRPAAVAAALQADPHGCGAGSLLPDREVLPRRGFPG